MNSFLKRRQLLSETCATTVLCLLAVSLALSPKRCFSHDTKQDVVIVLCDDFNPFYTGFAGDPDVRTPNLDELARESASFSRCYAASTVCMPSRTSLITGLYPHSTGCWGNASTLFVPPDLTSMFSDFKQAGYNTAVIGKTHWYAGTKFKNQFASKKEYFTAIGIDQFHEVVTTFGSRTGSGPYQDFLREAGLFEQQSRDLTDRLRNNQYVARPSLLAPEQTCDWMMTDLAVECLNEASKALPLAMLVGFSNPHSPFDPSGHYASMYDPETVTLRANVKPFKKYNTDYSLAELRQARAAYLGKISFIDDLVGRIIAALKQRGTWEKTILVFTADHGLAVGEHGNIAKGMFWEEVARVPMVIRVPGLTDSGVKPDTLAQLIDLYPTLLDAVGGKVASHVQGRSLLPAIRDPSVRVRTSVLCEIHHNQSLDYMVRDDRFKWFVEGGSESLYDLDADPLEQTNLIDSTQHQEASLAMRAQLLEFLSKQQLNYSVGYRPLAERVKAETD
jgi:arylsulfatase